MITNKHNKSEFLKISTASTNQSKILAITETHLNSKQHFDAEIIKHFPNYHIMRADRDVEFDPDDEDQLVSRGGCMLLISPNIISIPKLQFSNGNCEVVIVELPEKATTIITIY